MGKRITEDERERQLFPLESKLQAYALKRLSTAPNLTAFKTIRSNVVGVSDLVICANGKFIAIELKRAASEKPTIAQREFLKEIERSGGSAGVAWTWGMIKLQLCLAGYDTGVFIPKEGEKNE